MSATFARWAALALAASLTPASAHAGHLRVLFDFDDETGALPTGALVADGAGDLFGTIQASPSSFGAVFELTPRGGLNVFYAFKGGMDGESPVGGLIRDGGGNFYGTTKLGGRGCGGDGCGTVFELSPGGVKTTLHTFKGGKDGQLPGWGVISDAAGNLYGTTEFGGIVCENENLGCGTVFEIAADGTERIVHAFKGGSEGALPQAHLISDAAGNFYGTTFAGGRGCSDFGCGTVFKLTPNGTMSVLYAFKGGADGTGPASELLADGAGNLYGTTNFGGSQSCEKNGCGTVFELAPDGTKTTLHLFKGKVDGSAPLGGLIADGAGSLYGTTSSGDGRPCCHRDTSSIFELAPDGTETLLYGAHGDGPTGFAGTLLARDGHLYGTSGYGGQNHDGTLFEVTP